MPTPFMGEIKICSWSYAPKSWAQCNGQLLPINQNQALFALYGTNFGGNGQTTFGLPDLRGRAAMHVGAGHVTGERGGETAHTLTTGEMPAHTHPLTAAGAQGSSGAPTGNFLASNTSLIYTAPQSLTTLANGTVSVVGGSQPHQNMQPSLVLNFCVALLGVFPSRN